MANESQKVYLNDVQRDLMQVVQARDTVLVAGRAFGKGMVHALWLRRNFEQMPGSMTGIISANIKGHWPIRSLQCWCIGSVGG